ncbi:MAG: nucleoside monophosphate kinase [Patescibacteria group bacterium]
MMPQTFIFIGRSGCGKGTQAERLKKYITEHDSEKREIFYFETGGGVRKFIGGSNFSSSLAKKINESGERQPSFLAIWLWVGGLIDNVKGGEHIILDGSPRTLLEAEVLTTAFNFYSRGEVNVVYMNVSREWSEERLSERGRADDATLAKRTKRSKWFDTDVMPAILYFKKTPFYKFHDINGEQTIDKVHEEIVNKLKSLS